MILLLPPVDSSDARFNVALDESTSPEAEAAPAEAAKADGAEAATEFGPMAEAATDLMAEAAIEVGSMAEAATEFGSPKQPPSLAR